MSDQIQTITDDLTTDIGRVRFFLRDRTNQPPVWTDDEVSWMILAACDLVSPVRALTMTQIYLAAYNGWEAAAGDAAKLAAIEKIAIFTDDTYKTWQAVKAQADRMFALAQQACVGQTSDSESFFGGTTAQTNNNVYNPDGTIVSVLEKW